MPSDVPDGLPPWFLRPQPAETHQGSLFPDELKTALATLQVSCDELARWHAQDWVSFGPERTAPLEKWEVDEVRFVRDVVRSGLSDALIDTLFAQLPRPMNFDPAAVAYSFSLGWVVARTDPEPDPFEVVEEHVEGWVASLGEDGDRCRLEELQRQIQGMLDSLPGTVGENRG